MSKQEKYKGYRFPIEVISFAVWSYFRLSISLRDVEILLMRRGIIVSHESIRSWTRNFGIDYASSLRKKAPRRGDKWHLDEQCLMINGQRHWLWRAIDQDGHELDILVQPRRNTKAAVRFFKKLLKGLEYTPRVIVTDKLRSYTAATKKILKSTEHRKHKGLNNRIEVAHQPTRLREKQMRKFKSSPQAQIFLSTFGVIKNLFRTGLYKLTSQAKRNRIIEAFATWDDVASRPNFA